MGYPKLVPCQHKFLWDADASNVAANSHTLTGVIPIFSAPAGCLIKRVTAQVQTLVAGSSSEIVGDGDNDDGYLEDGFAAATGVFPLYNQAPATTFVGAYMLNSVAGGTDALDVSIEHSDKYYAAADTIDFKIGGTASAGKILFIIDFERL